MFTFIVRWRDESGKDLSFCNRETRVLTTSKESAREYIKRTYKDKVIDIASITQEEKKTRVCECCGQITYKNYL